MHEIVLGRTGSIVVAALVCLSVTLNSVISDEDKLLVLI